MRKITGALLLSPLLVATSSPAANWSAGVQGGLYQLPYQTRHQERWALPYIGYDGKTWYIDGTEAGYNFINTDTLLLRAKVYYYDTQYRASMGQTPALRGLNNRNSTMMGGMQLLYTTPLGALSATLAADTLGVSNGVVANAGWIAMAQWGGFTLVPEVGVDFSNAQNTRYYYGISDKESAKTGLATWRPQASFLPYARLAMNYAWTPQWNTWAQLTQRFYPDTISDSPMVNKNNLRELTVGMSYTF
ncbi:MltA-interacting protein precursor [Cedecea davisae]|uniref:MltA-interacting protein MipA n=1 Tax=Cedecea davisae DSM 4568 TaxID=566551 RepID=S3IPW9_9ENTR|nr:MipA/OmpV family protein [Cedecea davisae]EPF15843.1 MltA-interacting protein MipA [Cedecea davisae DSM 4568]SUX38597.1 MltA-interacting protein precursor [Cedecea davisae]